MRLAVQKTYKLYIGGQFPRTESGRSYPVTDNKGNILAHACLASRKDLRNAVVAARKAQPGWAAKSAYNRSQILYRMCEMMESRATSLEEELQNQGLTQPRAETEVINAIERLVYYAGWCDKYQALFSTVNPAQGSYFNFSVPEPTGVVLVLAPGTPSLLGLVSVIAPVIAGGNTCVVLASEDNPLVAVTFAEVLHTSDLPGGVVNILTGNPEELMPVAAAHKDIDAIWLARKSFEPEPELLDACTDNLKRVVAFQPRWISESGEHPRMIMAFQEMKTTWHPVQPTHGGSGGY